MSKTASDTVRAKQWPWPTFAVISAWLIGMALWRSLVPATHGYPMRREQVLTMMLDGMLIIGVVGAWWRVTVSDDALALKHVRDGLLLAALVAGVTLFVIRLTSTAAWWTGHLAYRY